MKLLTAGLAIALLGTAGIASADHNERQISGGSAHELFRERGSSIAAPEIDPASMVAGITLLGGALVVLMGRRATNRKY
jgi:hypothetical protein